MYESNVHSYETYIRYSTVICPSSKITFVENLVSTKRNQLLITLYFEMVLEIIFGEFWDSDVSRCDV